MTTSSSSNEFLSRVILALGIFVLSTAVARADFINLTGAETSNNIAEIYVLDDRVKLILEIYVGDLELFSELVPDDWVKEDAPDRPPLQERMRHFAEHTIQVRTGANETLPAVLDLVEPRMRIDRKSPFAGMINPMTRRMVPDAPADKRVLYAEISYPFAGKPTELTFVPPQDEQGRPTAGIGFIAYHKSVPVIDFRYLGAPARLELNWEDPWYSKFDNPNLKRHHKSALMSFLYVEPYEVRHEILVRVKDMGEWMDLGLRGDTFIEVDELDGLRNRIGNYLLGRNPVRIDEQEISPILDRTNFVKVARSGIQLLEVPERLEISTAIVGVIITYLTDKLPQQVTVDWELFTEQVQRVPATATDPAGPLQTYLMPGDNVHVWKNFLKNYKAPTVQEISIEDSVGELELPLGTILALIILIPLGWLISRRMRRGEPVKWHAAVLVSIMAVGIASYPYVKLVVSRPVIAAADLNETQSSELLEQLLKNVYRAFDFRGEEQVYDKLALTVHGDLLADLYLQNRQSFAIQKAGGAQAKIKQVEIEKALAKKREDGSPGYDIAGRWTAQGSVGHWGHTHTRKNLYDAIVTIEPFDGHWKITGLELLEEKRVDSDASVK